MIFVVTPPLRVMQVNPQRDESGICPVWLNAGGSASGIVCTCCDNPRSTAQRCSDNVSGQCATSGDASVPVECRRRVVWAAVRSHPGWGRCLDGLGVVKNATVVLVGLLPLPSGGLLVGELRPGPFPGPCLATITHPSPFRLCGEGRPASRPTASTTLAVRRGVETDRPLQYRYAPAPALALFQHHARPWLQPGRSHCRSTQDSVPHWIRP